jgi:hypothetical protein
MSQVSTPGNEPAPKQLASTKRASVRKANETGWNAAIFVARVAARTMRLSARAYNVLAFEG